MRGHGGPWPDPGGEHGRLPRRVGPPRLLSGGRYPGGNLDGLRNFEEQCAKCEIRRAFTPGAPTCPEADCGVGSGGKAYSAVIKAAGLDDCTSKACENEFLTLCAVYNSCPSKTLTEAQERGLHDLEMPCMDARCHVVDGDDQLLACKEEHDHDGHNHAEHSGHGKAEGEGSGISEDAAETEDATTNITAPESNATEATPMGSPAALLTGSLTGSPVESPSESSVRSRTKSPNETPEATATTAPTAADDSHCACAPCDGITVNATADASAGRGRGRGDARHCRGDGGGDRSQLR